MLNYQRVKKQRLVPSKLRSGSLNQENTQPSFPQLGTIRDIISVRNLRSTKCRGMRCPQPAFNIEIGILNSQMLVASCFCVHAGQYAPRQAVSYEEKPLGITLRKGCKEACKFWRHKVTNVTGAKWLFFSQFFSIFFPQSHLRDITKRLAKCWHPSTSLEVTQVGFRTRDHHLSRARISTSAPCRQPARTGYNWLQVTPSRSTKHPKLLMLLQYGLDTTYFWALPLNKVTIRSQCTATVCMAVTNGAKKSQ